MTAGGDRRFGRQSFEDHFAAAEDPWHYSSHYETTKYRQTLSLVPTPPPLRALEVGCAEGHFTAQLAPRVGHLTAVDISTVALERARHRCADYANVSFTQLDIFEDELPGPFDLIICSELLYYAGDLNVLGRACDTLASALLPGGHLVTAHPHMLIDGPADAAFDFDNHVAGMVGIQNALMATGQVTLSDEIRTDLYRVQRYVRSPPPSAPTPVRSRTEPMGVLSPSVEACVIWGAGTTPPSEPRLTTLTFHRISEHGPPALDPYRVEPAAFAELLRALWEGGYRTVSLDRWRLACAGQVSVPKLPLVLTFDDGYLDFLTDAWPALQRYGYGALVSLVTEHVGGSNVWDSEFGPPIPLMDWAAVVELHKQGVEFAAHSANHRRLTQLDPLEARREISTSKAQLEERVGDEVTTFVYPWNDNNEGVEQLVSECGFALALNGRFGLAYPDDYPFDLPRIEVEGEATPETMLEQIARARQQPRTIRPPAGPPPPEGWRIRARKLRWRIAGKARSLMAGRGHRS